MSGIELALNSTVKQAIQKAGASAHDGIHQKAFLMRTYLTDSILLVKGGAGSTALSAYRLKRSVDLGIVSWANTSANGTVLSGLHFSFIELYGDVNGLLARASMELWRGERSEIGGRPWGY